MKNKILVALTAVFVLGLAVAVYAFNQTSGDAHSASSKMENCPMKNQSAQTTMTENHAGDSCCDSENCCCKTGACPMKAKGVEKSATADCCADCCGGSCPMKNKKSETAVVKTDGESCHHDKNAGV